MAIKVLGKVLRYAGSSAFRVEQRRLAQQSGVDPSHQDLSIEAAGK